MLGHSKNMSMTVAPEDRGRRPEWRSFLPWLAPLGFLVIVLVPSGWPQGTAFLVLAVLLAAHVVIQRRNLDSRRRLSLSLLAAALLVVAIQEIIGSSYTVMVLVSIPVILILVIPFFGLDADLWV